MIAQFPPVYFALIMATGIISIACNAIGLHVIAWGLFILNIVQYLTCLGATLLRLFKYPQFLWQDLTHHAKGPAFLTLVAGTNILGVQFFLLTDFTTLPIVIWAAGCLFWVVLMYAMLTGVTITKNKPTLEDGLSGAWLLCTVSSASVCVLGTFVASHISFSANVLFVCLLAYVIGVMLYILVISQIFYRWIFVEMKQAAFSPSYWINMGALAITTLAGARLLIAGGNDPLIQSISPFILGVTTLAWAFACWWIPLLVALFAYRRIAYGIKISYDIQNWSVIFPLGMFCVASFNYLPLVHQNWLEAPVRMFVYLALLCWGCTFFGLLKSFSKKPEASFEQ